MKSTGKQTWIIEAMDNGRWERATRDTFDTEGQAQLSVIALDYLHIPFRVVPLLPLPPPTEAEVERLRSALGQSIESVKRELDARRKAEAEVERLRAALERISGYAPCQLDGEWQDDDGATLSEREATFRRNLHRESCKKCIARAALAAGRILDGRIWDEMPHGAR